MQRSRPLEILVIEDEPAYQLLIREAIESGSSRNNIHVLDNGLDALDFLKRKGKYGDAPSPEFIILDLHLPGASGYEILKYVKSGATSKLKSIPVIVFSSSDENNDIAGAYDLYANAYVCKTHNYSDFREIFKAIELFWMHVVQLPTDDFYNRD